MIVILIFMMENKFQIVVNMIMPEDLWIKFLRINIKKVMFFLNIFVKKIYLIF